MYEIQLTLTVKGITSKNDAQDYAISVCEHLNDTFNDDGNLLPLMDYNVQKAVKK